MWFLLVKIFFLLCLAALLGAALAWWWMRRHFVDVTEQHSELTHQVDSLMNRERALTRDDVDRSLSSAFSSYRPPQPDLMPLHQRLEDLERKVTAPDPNAAGMIDKLNGLEQSVSAISAALASLRSVNLEAMDQHLKGVSARIDNLRMPDIDSVNSRINALSSHVTENRAPDLQPRLDRIENLVSSISVPETDLGPVHSGLAALQVAVENLELPEPNLAPLEARLEALQDRIDEIAIRTDVDAVIQRVESLEKAVLDVHIPEPDLTPIMDRFAGLQSRLETVPSSDSLLPTLIGIESDLDVLSRRTNDLEPVYSQLAALDASMSGIRTDLRGQGRTESIERRLSALQDAVLNLPQPDYTRIDLALRSIESTFDLGALEDRLTAIEYGLSAVHHMLRARGEPVRTETESRSRVEVTQSFEPRPAPRPQRAVSVPELPPRPPRRSDPIARAIREDDEANLLTHAAFGASDELEQIVGVGPMLTELLHEIGVFYFWQIAEWTDEDVTYVDDKLLHFKGRIERDNWVGQARQLAALPTSAKRPSED